jgi:hypothetical protein
VGEVLLDMELHRRRLAAQDGNELRQQIWADRVNGAQPQRPRQRVAAGGGEVLDARSLFEHALRLLDDLLAGRRHCDFARPALEQRDAELLLELLHRHGKRGLRHEAGLRRVPEVPLARHRDDVAQLRERHRERRAR